MTHFGYDERRGKAAMDEIGILPQFTGTLVRDAFASSKWYGQCCHSLCNSHLLRDLLFIEESDPAQKVQAAPEASLLLKIKDAAAAAKAVGDVQLGEDRKNAFLRRFDQLVRKADRINLPPSKRNDEHDSLRKKRSVQLTPRTDQPAAAAP